MDLQEYSKLASLTALYPNRGSNLSYAVLGLAGESGEVAGKIANYLSTNTTFTDDQKQNIKKELGDVLWYINASFHEAGLDFIYTSLDDVLNTMEDVEIIKDSDIWVPFLKLTEASGKVSERTKKLMRDHGGIITESYRELIRYDLLKVLRILGLCGSIIGYSLEDIAFTNIHKLFDRGLRNKIKGDGDNR